MTCHPQTGQFIWWRYADDGTIEMDLDCDEAVDANPSGYTGSIEGAIIHGGIKATAFDLKTEDVYDTKEWFKTGVMVPSGTMTTLKITAEWKATS